MAGARSACWSQRGRSRSRGTRGPRGRTPGGTGRCRRARSRGRSSACALGMRSASSWDWLLATMTSLSPLATNVGWVILLRSCGLPRPASRIARSCAHPRLLRDRLVAVGRAFLQTGDVLGRRALARRVAVEEQEMPWVHASQRRLGVRASDDQRHLGQPAAAAHAGAGQDQPPHEFGMRERDLLRDAAAEREAEEVDVLVAERADERGRRRRPSRRSCAGPCRPWRRRRGCRT